jgi:hypothetical protein
MSQAAETLWSRTRDSEDVRIRIMPFVIGCLALGAPRVTLVLVAVFSN